MPPTPPTRRDDERAARAWVVAALAALSIDEAAVVFVPRNGPAPPFDSYATVQVVGRQRVGTASHRTLDQPAPGGADGYLGKTRRAVRVRVDLNVYGPQHALLAEAITHHAERPGTPTLPIERLGEWTDLTGLVGEDWQGRSRAQLQLLVHITHERAVAHVIEDVEARIITPTPIP